MISPEPEKLAMTDAMMVLRGLTTKSADADLLREMIGHLEEPHVLAFGPAI